MEEMSKQTIVEFIKFGIVGFSSTIINFGLYYLLVWLDVQYLIANLIGWLCSVVNTFYWNNKYVFSSDSHWFVVLLRTYATYILSLVLTSVLLWLLVDWMGLSEWISPIIVLMTTVPINFVINKFWTFK